MLDEILQGSLETIVEAWTDRVRALTPGKGLSERALVDHVPAILKDIQRALRDGTTPDRPSPPHETHAVQRLGQGFDLRQVVNEYAVLRHCILDVVERDHPQMRVSELRQLDATIDRFIAEAATCYAELHERREADVLKSDVAEQKRARQVAECRSVELDAVLDAIPDAVFVRDESGVTRANRAALELPRDVPDIGNQERRLQDPDGQEVVVRFASAPVLREGQHVGTVTVATDVTTQRRSEEAHRFLAVARATLAESLDTDTTLAAISDLAVPTFADWAAVHLLGPDGQIRPVAMAHADPTRVALALEYQERYPGDPDDAVGLAHVMRSGEPVWISEISDDWLAAFARDDARLQMLRQLDVRSYMIVPLVARGRTLGALSFMCETSGRRFDVTDFEIARELARTAALAVDNARLYGDAQEAIRLRDHVLAVVTHDLRTPLSTLRSSTILLRRQLPDGSSEAHRSIERVERAAHRMQRLIADLQDMVSIRAGKLALARRPHDAEALLRAAVEEHAGSMREESITLLSTCDTGGARIACDSDRILQVFGNLIGNAARFTGPGGTITVEAALEGPYVRFSVSDTGPGVPEADRATVFDAWVSAGDTSKRGTGLGLYIARGIVEGHGGRIWLEPEGRSGGATFSFRLPAIL